jgi:hypothetical protein
MHRTTEARGDDALLGAAKGEPRERSHALSFREFPRVEGSRMSLSPKADPRTWLVPGVKRPPLQARLLYYDLTTSQRALLRAGVEYAPEGALWEASLETYAETSARSKKTIYNLIWGWNTVDKRPPGFIGPMNARHTPGFIECGVLTCERKAKQGRGAHRTHSKTSAFRFHEEKLQLRPDVLAHLKAGVQQDLPLPEVPPTDTQAQPETLPETQPTNSVMVADLQRSNSAVVAELTPETPANAAMVAADSKATTSIPKDRFKNSNPSSMARPTLDEVKAYCQERKSQGHPAVDPEHWLDYYLANGWKVGRNPMKDWQASIRTWERRASHGNGFGTSKQTGAFHRGEVDYGGYDEYDNNPKPPKPKLQ